MGTIVVGVDGSEGSRAALALAAREATRPHDDRDAVMNVQEPTHQTHGEHAGPITSLDTRRVADVMHPGVMTCHSGATVHDVARTMATHGVHSVGSGEMRARTRSGSAG